jgi:hypothetical protein
MGGDLYQKANEGTRFNEQRTVQSVVAPFLLALQYLHSQVSRGTWAAHNARGVNGWLYNTALATVASAMSPSQMACYKRYGRFPCVLRFAQYSLSALLSSPM